MTAPTGWLCPSCKKAHGPHVDTCPTPPLFAPQVQVPAGPNPFGGVAGGVVGVQRTPSDYATVVLRNDAGAERGTICTHPDCIGYGRAGACDIREKEA